MPALGVVAIALQSADSAGLLDVSAGNDPEPVLGDLVQQMAGGRYDYDYVTYDVYESDYSSVSYAAPAVVYTPSYGYASSYYCDPFYDYYCDSYYYSPSRFSVAISLRAESCVAGVPPRRDNRSGAIATKPSLASCSVVCLTKSDMPKIS